MRRWALGWVVGTVFVVASAGPESLPAGAQGSPPVCAPGGPPVVFDGGAAPADAKTYRLLPFEVADGTTRVEVGYAWDDVIGLPDTPVSGLIASVIDLGLWDADGPRSVDGFRGWSGSRQGKTAEGQSPVFVQADAAERGYRPGPVEAGVWHVELGIAAVGPTGLTYSVTVTCHDPDVGPPPPFDPVDAGHVAASEPGWYTGDFHMHGVHSHPSAPPFDDGDPGSLTSFVDHARSAGLDFLPITEYVVTHHHGELGPVQRANPDLVIWPGREIITYFGHAITLGETPNTVEYRHGLDDITLGAIQAETVADGAVFGVAHPTIFPGPLFERLCRGCEFTLGGEIDWDLVTTIELVTGPMLVDDSQLGGPGLPVKIQNPFVQSAIDLWESKLLAGHRITAVSGSDDKLGPGFGSPATKVYADELSRRALIEGLEEGRAYIQTLGVDDSPTLSLTARGGDGATAMMGETITGSSATVTVEVDGATNQLLLVTRNGQPFDLQLITSNSFTHTFEATTTAGSGPLGTFYRADTLRLADLDGAISGPVLTTISNPIFLQPPGGDGMGPEPDTPPPTVPVELSPLHQSPAPLPVLPRTGGTAPMLVGATAAMTAIVVRRWVLRRPATHVTPPAMPTGDRTRVLCWRRLS